MNSETKQCKTNENNYQTFIILNGILKWYKISKWAKLHHHFVENRRNLVKYVCVCAQSAMLHWNQLWNCMDNVQYQVLNHSKMISVWCGCCWVQAIHSCAVREGHERCVCRAFMVFENIIKLVLAMLLLLLLLPFSAPSCYSPHLMKS